MSVDLEQSTKPAYKIKVDDEYIGDEIMFTKPGLSNETDQWCLITESFSEILTSKQLRAVADKLDDLNVVISGGESE